MLIRIGSIKLLVKALAGRSLPKLPPIYGQFRSGGRPHATLVLHKTRQFCRDFRSAHFYKTGILTFYWSKPRHYYFAFDNIEGFGEIDERGNSFSFTGPVFTPALYNLIIETVYTFLISKIVSEGIIFHACGTVDGRKGYIFPARSGGGKSTIGKLALESKKTLLNDDRIIIREIDNRVIAYGNPWHGEVSRVVSAGATLKRIFFLKKGKRNSLKRLDQRATTIRLMANTFFFPLEQKSKVNLLDKCIRLARRVPAYDLTFYPDARVWGYIESESAQGRRMTANIPNDYKHHAKSL